MTQIFHLVIPRGSALRQRLDLKHALMIACDLAESAGPTSVRIYPPGFSAPTGTTFTHCCKTFTLAAALTPTSTTLSLTSAPCAVAEGSVLQIKAVDCTNWSGNCQIRDLSGLVVGTPVVSYPDPAGGTVAIALDNTEAIAANSRWEDLVGIQLSDVGNPLAEIDKTTASRITKAAALAYRWDLETIDAAGLVTRRLEGYCWVTSDETR